MKRSNIVISLLVVLNLLLIYKFMKATSVKQNPKILIKNSNIYDKIIKVDTLIIDNWESKSKMSLNLNKPTILFFFL